ncbi:30S ribosomal protein S4 [Candidatus Woesearchaeota archaeon]|nr:30S ribosomal protein S4 [Candidatus Woesearchaeota archaeon]
MGSIKKQSKKYSPPSHPWQRERLEEERKLSKEYGVKNKKEIWKASYMLGRFKRVAKKLIASSSSQGDVEKRQLIDRLKKYGLADDGTRMENVLNLNVNDIMNRRLQTIVYRGNMARSIEQARQFIVHGHVIIEGRKVTTPSYLVLKREETNVIFDPSSSLASNEHPERMTIEMKKAAEKEDENGAKKEEKDRRNAGRKEGKRNRARKRPEGKK